MDNKKYYELTEEGRLNLEREKQHLIDVDRPNNIKALQDARSQGDLSENADYDAAREEQSRIEARIAEITEILKNVKIITKDSSNRVTTGKNVTIEFIGMNKLNLMISLVQLKLIHLSIRFQMNLLLERLLWAMIRELL